MPDIFFNSEQLPEPKECYVAFIDIMGTRNRMAHSVKESANFIFKLHAAVIAAWRQKAYSGVFVYPVMDGVYITALKRVDMENIVFKVFRNLSELFLKEPNQYFRFVIRGSVAFGKVINGHHVPYEASKVFEKCLGYKDNILLGEAMIRAFDGERMAAPFGFYVDSTAQNQMGSFSQDWKWYNYDQKLGFEKTVLRDNIVRYFEQFRDVGNPLHYSELKIDEHINKVNEYFIDIE